MIEKVISGGQTGADRAALEAAKELGVPTGGAAPKFFKTQNGPDPTLADFGLIALNSHDYKVRTLRNINDCDYTIIVGLLIGGSLYTQKGCMSLYKPYMHLKHYADYLKSKDAVLNSLSKVKILNVSGNRETKNPGVFTETYNIVKDILINVNNLQ